MFNTVRHSSQHQTFGYGVGLLAVEGKTLSAPHTQTPCVINGDKNQRLPPAVNEFKADEQLPETTELRPVKYLNNRVELFACFFKGKFNDQAMISS